MPIEAFECGHSKTEDNVGKDGPYMYCRTCKRQHTAEWQKRNLEKSRAASRAWNRAHPAHHAALVKRSRLIMQTGPGAPEHFDEQMRLQEGKCAICTQLMKKACSDHNHETKQRRGMLCDCCNRALGMFKDSVPILESAVAYLNKWHAAAKPV
jgi:hypothetical protein